MRKRIAALALVAICTLTACNPPLMTNWGWWKARDNGVQPRQPITVDIRNQFFGESWVAVLGVVNQKAGLDVMVPASWRGVPDSQADVTFQPYSSGCAAAGNCHQRHHMWAPQYPCNVFQSCAPFPPAPTVSQAFVGKCVVHWDTDFWRPWDPGWQAFYWHWQVVLHEVWHCMGYPDVVPPTDYVGVMSYYAFWDVGYRSANWFGADDREMLVRDGYGI